MTVFQSLTSVPSEYKKRQSVPRTAGLAADSNYLIFDSELRLKFIEFPLKFFRIRSYDLF